MTAKFMKKIGTQKRSVDKDPATPENSNVTPETVVVILQPKPMQVAPTASAGLIHQERTKLVTLPETVFLEADPATIKKSKGHQIDPSRPASCIPVMPNLAVLKATGNPYPAEANDTVEPSDPRWADYVKIGHHAFAVLAENGEVRGRDNAVIKTVLERAGMMPDTAYIETAVQDAFRDLALCGLAVPLMMGRSRIFRAAAPNA